MADSPRNTPPVSAGKADAMAMLEQLHAASLKRWENRRQHEWTLNYAIWTGLAAVSALIWAAEIPALAPFTVFSAAVAVSCLQVLYLWPVTSRAIAEIELQSDIERAWIAMVNESGLLHSVDQIRPEMAGAAMHGRLLADKRYGVWAPVIVTLLLFSAIWLTPAIKGNAKPTSPAPAIQVNCPPYAPAK